jgi:hypothetical protein
MLLPFFKWCEGSWFGQTVSNSVYLFPVIEAFHLLALAVIGGAVLIVDMRLVGLGMRRQSVSRVAKGAEPWLIGSLLVMLVTGFLLMTSEAMRCYYNLAFWVKMWSLLFAMIFTFTIQRTVVRADASTVTPTRAKLVAVISLLLWSGVGIGGRGIGFY